MKTSGFTVVEMLVTIAIMAIVLSIGVPSFQSLMGNSNMSSNCSDMITALNYARMEAVKRGTSIKVAPDDGTDWTSGLVVSVESSGEELRLWSEFNSGSSLSSENDLTQLVFTLSGEVDDADQFTLCDDRSDETGRQITILASGAVYAEEIECS